MKLNKKIFSFDWLVQISPVTLFLLTITIPILFFIWFYKAGQLLEKRLSLKPNFLFRIFITTFFLGLVFTILPATIGGDSQLIFEKYISYFFWVLYISFLYCDFYLTSLFSKHKDKNENEYNSTILEKVGIFFTLSLLTLGAAVLQPKLNEIFNEQRKP